MSRRDTRCSSISAVSSYVAVATPNVTSIAIDVTTEEPASDTATSDTPIANPEIKIHGAIQRRPISMTVMVPAMRQPTPIAVVTKPEYASDFRRSSTAMTTARTSSAPMTT